MLSFSEQEALIAPCGMNCALCSAYQAQTLDLGKQGIRWKSCPGCIPRGQYCLYMGDSCEHLRKGRMRFCYLCGDFPCARLKRLDTRYRTRYHMSMIENLRFISDRGIAAFLENQRSRWACKTCGADYMVCCHKGLCLHCGLAVLLQNRRHQWDANDVPAHEGEGYANQS